MQEKSIYDLLFLAHKFLALLQAVRLQKEFYGGGGTVETTAAGSPPREQQAPTSDPLQNLDVAAKQQLLLKLLAESPDMAALLTALAGRSE